MSKPWFVIDSLARVGSTTLAAALNEHPDIQCNIEPFHPRRNNGAYLRLALSSNSVVPACDLLRMKWSGIKHVWEADTQWPFIDNPALNEQIVLNAERVILIERKNLLQRYISHMLCRRMNLWIGPREDFVKRLQSISLPELNAVDVITALRNDARAVEGRKRLLNDNKILFTSVIYEDLLAAGVTESEQFNAIRQITKFIGCRDLLASEFETRCLPWFDRCSYQWATRDVYQLIPQSDVLDQKAREEGLGHLF